MSFQQKLDVLTVCETKVKGRGEVIDWISRVQRRKAKEGLDTLLSEQIFLIMKGEDLKSAKLLPLTGKH